LTSVPVVNDASSLKTKAKPEDVDSKRKFLNGLSGLLVVPENLQLSMENLVRGIDNYRIDVQLSPDFVFRVNEAIDELITRGIEAGSPLTSKHPVFDSMRLSYFDMMSMLIHRTKTDLAPQQILFLQFAVIKYLLQQVRQRLDKTIAKLQESASRQKSSGSARMLRTHQQVVWLRKKYNSILYRTNQQLFKQLYRPEITQLHFDRKRCLSGFLPKAVDILFNPMLHAQSPDDSEMLFDQYALWNDQKNGFADLNGKWEKLLKGFSSFAPVSRIKSAQRVEATKTAVFDELGGLFAVQSLLGFTEEQRGSLVESLSWMEEPENIRVLFDEAQNRQQNAAIRKHGSFLSKWKYQRQRNKATGLIKLMTKHLRDGGRLRMLLASYELRPLWSRNLAEMVQPMQLCELIAGVESRKTKSLRNELSLKNEVLGKLIQEAAKRVEAEAKTTPEEKIIQILSDLSKYRLHLKYYRFAHRIFNRISILDSNEDIELAKHGNQLYRLFAETEVEDVASRIIHHTIIKADVRGSTTVTSELVNKGLNPASYFSQRFFDPINELLATYGAGKVFIEGDAVILSLMELEDAPQQWFAISRACGLAREMIQVVASNNVFSERTGLPYLEIGIGICYSEEAPLFLFDEGKPIMISRAIGDADRMSSCSWKMREKHKASIFNVEVCRIAEGERSKGEKGQEQVRYNVNGILLDEAAVNKLKTEIMLKKITIKISGEDTLFLAGQFPDVQGKNRDLVIRQAKLGLWKNEEVIRSNQSNEYFYEVVTHQKVLLHVGERLK
jgi:hypothetical protein